MMSVPKDNTERAAAPSCILDNARKRLGITHPLILDFCRHWLDIRHGQPVPLKRDIDPMAIPSCLPHVWLYEYDPLQDVFICRLAGEEINLAWGHSIKGMSLHQIVGPEYAPAIHPRWRDLLKVPAIMHGRRNEEFTRHWHMNAERLVLPLADNENGHATHLIGISIYQAANEHGTAPVLRDRDIVTLPCREI